MTFKRAILLSILAELLIALLAIYTYGLTLEGLQATTRFSGRFSLAIFSCIFILLSVNRVQLHAILSNKPFHIFAIVHGIHLMELISYVLLSKNDLIPIRLAGGFLAYVFIFLMPFLYSHFQSGKIDPKKYSMIINVYSYYVWFIFFMSYLPRVQGKLPHVGGSYWEFVVLFIWVCVLMSIKLIAPFSKKAMT